MKHTMFVVKVDADDQADKTPNLAELGQQLHLTHMYKQRHDVIVTYRGTEFQIDWQFVTAAGTRTFN